MEHLGLFCVVVVSFVVVGIVVRNNVGIFLTHGEGIHVKYSNTSGLDDDFIDKRRDETRHMEP